MIEKKQARTYDEIERDLALAAEEEALAEDEDEEEEEEKPIYNPLNLPLGWDGKPIPYWLYKLHGLNLEFKCEICGNYSYWGPRPFERHFQEWRHSYGMKCLGIPNTKPFQGITLIEDAYTLWAKLRAEQGSTSFNSELDEEFEDRAGNVMNRKTYTDLARQGLLDWCICICACMYMYMSRDKAFSTMHIFHAYTECVWLCAYAYVRMHMCVCVRPSPHVDAHAYIACMRVQAVHAYAYSCGGEQRLGGRNACMRMHICICVYVWREQRWRWRLLPEAIHTCTCACACKRWWRHLLVSRCAGARDAPELEVCRGSTRAAAGARGLRQGTPSASASPLGLEAWQGSRHGCSALLCVVRPGSVKHNSEHWQNTARRTFSARRRGRMPRAV